MDNKAQLQLNDSTITEDWQTHAGIEIASKIDCYVITDFGYLCAYDRTDIYMHPPFPATSPLNLSRNIGTTCCVEDILISVNCTGT